MTRKYADVLNGKFGDEIPQRMGRDLSVIFGSGFRLAEAVDNRSRRRIAVYPCVTGPDDTEIAQGIMCLLSWYTNSVEGVTAIPVLVSDPSLETWSPANSAFTPESFSLDELGEDSTIVSELTQGEQGYILVCVATSELEDEEDLRVEVRGNSLTDLLAEFVLQLPQFARWISGLEGENDLKGFVFSGSELALRDWLTTAFHWHLSTLHSAVVEARLELGPAHFMEKTAEFSQPVATWFLVNGAVLMSVWFERVDDGAIVSFCKSLNDWEIAVPSLSRMLVELDRTRVAVELLEHAVEQSPQYARNWLVLARIYLAAQRPDLMVEVLQRAIEVHKAEASLLMAYGETLITLAEDGVSLPSSILIDEDQEYSTWNEAAAAFREVISLTSNDQRCMGYVQLILVLSNSDVGQLLPVFRELATFDSTGLYTELALNIIAAREDIQEVLTGLEQATQFFKNSASVWRNLGYAQYLCGEAKAAGRSFEQALERANTNRSRGEYELLSIYAQDAAIESQLAEVADLVAAGNELTERNLEFLEWIVAEAPHYSEGYLLLARAYAAEGEGETALEVLLDAEKNVELEPEILVAIVDLLTEAGEDSVALEYVMKGLDAFPRSVPLLARAAQVTHGLGDDDGARTFLRQAHNISPYHKELLRVTRELTERGDGD